MSDPYRRDAASTGQGDPLAELARLIGQNDPFADLGRPQRAAANPRSVEAQWHSDAAEASQHPQAEAYREPYAASDPRYGAAHEAAAYQQPHDDGAQYQHYQQDPADPYQHAQDQHAQGQYAQNAHAEPQALHAEAPQVADQGYGQQAYEPGYEQQHAYEQQHDYAYRPQQDYSDEPHPAAYDEPAPVRRRGGLVAVMGVVALAVVGTAGAYGYRAMFGTGGSSPTTAPVIKAAETPNKVQVASAPDSSKPIQDRLPDRPQAERVVPREEQPVDVRTTAAAGNPNIVFPRLAAPNTAPASANPVLPQVASSAGPGITAEPKKIRTVAIREDANGTPRAQPTPPSQTRSVAPQASAAPTSTASADTAFPAGTRAAARPEPAGNGPMSLSPTGSSGAAPAPATRNNRIQTAAATPADGTAAGSYVQVSSRESEAAAQTAFRTLQGKYPSVLGGKAVVVRRADLSVGVRYRAMVGPFASKQQAVQLCSSLKSAGGDCVVIH